MKPKHIAIIMDGNRRWAKSNNLSVFEAYEKGLETLQYNKKLCQIKNQPFNSFLGFQQKTGPGPKKRFLI